jgi:hypothetical protein
MFTPARLASLLACSLSFACVGGSSATSSGTNSTGAGGSGPAGCIKVDCSVDANESTPECGYSAEPGSIGDGPAFLGDSPDLRRGFVENATVYLTYRAGENGAVFSVDTQSGERTFLSGVIEDPQTGPQPRGIGENLGSPWDVGRAPGGKLYVLVDNDMGRPILLIDESSGDGEQVVDLSMAPCSIGGESVQLDPQFEVLPNGDLLFIGDANGGSGLFEIDAATNLCTTLSFASDDANQVGTGPRFYGFRSLTLADTKVYVSDEPSESLVEIDLSTGARLRVSSTDTATPFGEGPYSGTESLLAQGGSVLAARDSLYSSGILTETELATGNRTELFVLGGPLSNPDQPWLYGASEGCFYFGNRDTLYVFDPASGLSNRVSR